MSFIKSRDFIVPVFIVGGYVTAYSLYSYYLFKKMKDNLEKLAKEEEQVENTVLYFGAEGLQDCTNHIYKKKMCYKVDCPYRKLRLLTSFCFMII